MNRTSHDALLYGQANYSQDYRCIDRFGKVHWLHEAVTIHPRGERQWELYGVWVDVTPTKAAAEALRESEERLRLLVENVRDYGIYLLNSQGQVISWSSGAQRLFGYTPEEIIGKSFTQFFAPDDVKEGKPRQNLLVAQSQGRCEDEGWRVRRDGSRFWANVVLAPIYDDNGGLRGFAKVIRDVTERKQMMEALSLSQERYSILSQATNDGIYDWSIQTDDLWLNDSFEALFGYQRAGITLPLDFWESRLHPADRKHIMESLRLAFEQQQQIWNAEYRFRRADGTYADVFDRGFIRYDEEQNALRMVGSMQDITARKRAEDELNHFFTLSLDLLCIADTQGYFRRLNPAFQATLGYSDQELMEQPFLTWVHPDDQAATKAQTAALASGESTHNFVNRYRCRDGSYKWLSWRSAPLEGLIYAAAHDITALKQAQEALQKTNDELELHVRSRTAELSAANQQLAEVNEALRIENIQHEMTMATLREMAEYLKTANEKTERARKEAEHANRAKSEFLSRMSHELRTPLNAIIGFGQILEMSELESSDQESIEHILKAGRHLLALINEVLDIARVEAGHLELSLEAVVVSDVTDEVCALLRPLAAERRIRLLEQLSRDVRTEDESQSQDRIRETTPVGNTSTLAVRADRQRLKQVLINLLSNAIKYNRLRGEVAVFCEEAPAPGDEGTSFLRIAVRDTGEGLSPEDLSKLFTPFERLKAAQSEVEGTGLGLALSKRMIEAMGGQLEVESRVGQGSTFSILLPLVTLEAESLGTVPSEHKQEKMVQPYSPSYTVLYIEDNLSNLRLIERILEKRSNIKLLAAMQGSVGLDLALQHNPDLILLDLNLPDISGQEVLSRLQRVPQTKDIPVVVVSADAMVSQQERLLAAGAKAYLTKPLNVTEFLVTIDKAVAARDMRQR